MRDVASELAQLRGRAPVAVDTVDRVMARIATLPPPTAIPERSRRWIGLAASGVGIALTAGLVGAWPAARAALGGAILESLAMSRSMGGSLFTVATLSRGFTRSAEVAGSTVGAVAATLEPFRPVANAASLALAVVTVAAALFIVIRDVSRAPLLEER